MTITIGRQWLQDLKPGDPVFVTQGGSVLFEKVERVTKAQVIVGGSRFNREDGSLRGETGRWYHTRLEPWDEAKAEQVLLRQRRNALAGTDWQSLPDDVVNRVYEIVREAQRGDGK
jgi:hypothetical protein